MAKLIVLEGTDGSGKGTQTKVLEEMLKGKGFKVSTLSFPRYSSASAQYITKYLRGEFGDASSIDPYIASLFYSIDRRDAKEGIEQMLALSDFIILDRYIDSNVGHQGSKIKDEDERAAYVDWLYQTEFETFGIPRPDLVVVLHVPVEISYALIEKKGERAHMKAGEKRDAHEKDLEHLRKAEDTYLWLADKYPENHAIVSCTDESGNLLPAQRITERIYDLLQSKQLV